MRSTHFLRVKILGAFVTGVLLFGFGAAGEAQEAGQAAGGAARGNFRLLSVVRQFEIRFL